MLSVRYNFLWAKTLCVAQNHCIMSLKVFLIPMSMKLKIKWARQCLKMNVRVTCPILSKSDSADKMNTNSKKCVCLFFKMQFNNKAIFARGVPVYMNEHCMDHQVYRDYFMVGECVRFLFTSCEGSLSERVSAANE